MTKYNDIKSIPINSLSKEELKIAMKEWAEGDDSMEKLLWALFNNDITTNGCHSGSGPFIGLDYEKEKKDKISKLMSSLILEKESQIVIRPDGGNPFSGPNWYKPDVTIGSFVEYKDIADALFDKLTKIINDEIKITTKMETKVLLDLLDFLIDKYTFLIIRLKNDNNTFFFSIESNTPKDSELYKYINENLTKLKFTLFLPKEENYKYWIYKTNNIKKLNATIKKVKTSLIENFSLKVPTNVDETNSFLVKAHLNRKKLSDKEFNEWLETEKNKALKK